ncbi:hypothetical protein LY76DRAFT_594948 [Colletotrichum caudatum]|nr:hypothetical protein LY76DRAFT_594948 [Colletotrichum caudatum]
MTEFGRIFLGLIPSPDPEPSFLVPSTVGGLAPIDIYFDDIFTKFPDWRQEWAFVRDHLLPRFLWAKVRLSRKKIGLGLELVVAMGWTHKVGGVA